jgi:hypothetical protein
MSFRFPFARKNKNKKPRASQTPYRRRPAFEILEDRVVPTLSFMTKPTSIQTGQIMPAFTVHSDQGMKVPISISLSAESTAGTPLLGGTATRDTDASGNVSFSDLYVYGGTAKNAVFTVTAPGPMGSTTPDKAASDPFQIKPGGSQLYVLSTIPTKEAGADLGAITVQVLQSGGSVDMNDNATKLQLYIANPAGNQVTQACNINGNTVTVKDVSALAFGMSVTGPGVPANTTVTGINRQNSSVTLSAAAGTATDVSLTFTPNFIDTQGKLIGPLSNSVTVSGGVATFTGLALDKAGIGYTLGVQAVNNTTLLPATSNAFVITAGAPTDLAFQIQPTFTDANPHTIMVNGKPVGVPLTINEYTPEPSLPFAWNGVVVQVVDKFANPVTSGLTGQVTMSTNGAFWPGINNDPNAIPPATTKANFNPDSQVAAFTNLIFNQTHQAGPPNKATAGSNMLTLDFVDQSSFAKGMAFYGPGFPQTAGVTITNLVLDNNNKNKVTLTLSQNADNTAGDNKPWFWNYSGNFTLTATAVGVKYNGADVTLAAATSQPFVVDPFQELSRKKLQFVSNFAPPAMAGVGKALPTVKVAITDQNDKVITSDNSTVIVLKGGGHIVGTLTKTVVGGVATFDDLALTGTGLNGTDTDKLNLFFGSQSVSTIAPLTPVVKQTPGDPYNLIIANRDIGKKEGDQTLPVVAGTYVTSTDNKALMVKVVDQYGNLVTNDNSTMVSVGLLPNQGRGPVFVGNSSMAGDQHPMDGTFDFQAVVKAVNGVASFDKLYIDFAGTGYILSAGTTSFATHAGADTAEFTVVANNTAQFVFANQPDASNNLTRLNFKGGQPVPGVTGVVVAAADAFGNLDTSFKGQVTVDVQAAAGNSNTASLVGTTTITASQGFAVINGAYVKQNGGNFGAGNNYQLTASGSGLTKATSDPFQLNPAAFDPNMTPNPTITVTIPGGSMVVSGKPFEVDVQLQAAGGNTPSLNGKAKVLLELRKDDGSYLITAPGATPVTLAYNNEAKPDENGLIKYFVTLTSPTKAKFQLLGLLDLNAQVKAIPIDDPPPGDEGPTLGGPNDTIIQYGLGSFVTNFDTIGQYPFYNFFPVGGRSYPPVVGFDPAIATGQNTPPAQVQPNEAPGFSQVAQSTKWWSSLLFQRTQVDPKSTDPTVPQDSKGNVLFALNADPWTAMVNNNNSIKLVPSAVNGMSVSGIDTTNLTEGMTVTGDGVPALTTISKVDPTNKAITLTKAITWTKGAKLSFNGNFAGLGLAYQTDMYIQPSLQFNDPPPPFVPPNQPKAWVNPQSPGNQTWSFPWFGNGTFREYQDFSVGLQGVQADGKVLSYSDWTVTLDWFGTDLNGKNQELQATLGQGLPFVYFTAPKASTNAGGTTIQLVTNPKTNFDSAKGKSFPIAVTVTAFNASGQQVTQGTGAFELEIKYTVEDVLNEITQTAPMLPAMSSTITLTSVAGLARGMTVTGIAPGQDPNTAPKLFAPGTIITDINGNTITLSAGSTNTTALSNVKLYFNTPITYVHDYGMYLPSGTAWSLKTGANGQTTFTANLTSKDYFSVATLPTPPGHKSGTFNPNFTLFLPHAYTFVTGSTSSFSFNQQTGQVLTTYALQTQVKQVTQGTSDIAPLQALSATQYNNLPAGELAALKSFNAAQATPQMQNATFAANSRTVTVADASTLSVGMTVSGAAAIPAGTTITAIMETVNTITLSAPTTSAGTNVSLSFGGNISYISPHGELLLFNGAVFHTQLQYTGVLPSVAPLLNNGNPLNGAAGDADLYFTYLLPLLRSISQQAQSDGGLSLNLLFPNDNNYLQAQAMYGAAQLVPMLLEIAQSTDPGLSAADRAQAASYAQDIYNQVKNRMGTWLDGAGSGTQALQLLYYQPATAQEVKTGKNPVAGQPGWQSLLTIAEGFLSGESLNDHQLIAGYFLKVAAFLAQYDRTWGQTTQAVNGGQQHLMGKMGDIVSLLVGDVSNYDRSSNAFPFLRNFNVWDGHSWAEGASNDDVGTNLESSSEAMNYDAALILYGQATGNTALRDLGVYLYTSELEGVRTYWFSMKNKTDPFGNQTNVIPAAYLGSAADGTQRTLVTKLNNNGGSYLGFIGFETSKVAGIQMLPFSGSAYYLGADPSFVSTTYTIAQKGATWQGRIPVGPPTYQSLLLPYEAFFNPAQALQDYKAALTPVNKIRPANPLDQIDNDAFNIHWIEQLLEYGQVDETVTANTISYAVFKNTANVRTFVAYNPGAIPIQVAFKDSTGTVLVTVTVAPFSTSVFDQAGNLRTQPLTNPNYALATPPNRLFFTTTGGANTLTYGKTGTGSVAANTVTWDGQKPLTFTMTGLSGTLTSQNAQASFEMFFDPTFRDPKLKLKSPTLNVTITYDQFGNGQNVVVQKFDNFDVGTLPGFVVYRSPQAGGSLALTTPRTVSFKAGDTSFTVSNPSGLVAGMTVTGPGIGNSTNLIGSKVLSVVGNTVNLDTPTTDPGTDVTVQFSGGPPGSVAIPTTLNNGKVTVTVTALTNVSAANPVRFSTNAAEQQGEVSFIDLPYNFTKVNGIAVNKLDLGGQTFGPALPSIAGPRSKIPGDRPKDPPNGFDVTLTGSTATFTAVNLDNQTLIITADPESGLLMNNRFATGDEGYASPFDFDSTQPGVQVLAATTASTVQIQGGRGDAIVVGSPDSAASSLLARFQVNTDAAGSGSLFIDDSGRDTGANYTVDKAGSGLGVTTDDGALSVTLQGNAFQNGFALTTGGSNNIVNVLATRAGESLTLDTKDPNENVQIGGGSGLNDVGVQNILGDVIVRNTSPGGFTHVFVDNLVGATAAPAVTVSDTAIVGLAPAVIRYDNSSIDDVSILAGGSDTTYSVTGSIGGSVIALGAGGNGSVILSHDGRVNPGFFPGTVSLLGGTRTLIVDDSAETAARNVAVNNGDITGLISRAGQFSILGFSNAEIRLGTGANTLSIDTADFAPLSATVTSGGDLNLLQARIDGDLNVTGGGTVTVGTVGGGTAISTQGGKVTIVAPAGITVNQTIDTSPGTGGTVTLGSNVTPSQSTDPKYQVGAGNIQLNDATTVRTIAVVSGSGQFTSVGTAFATALVAKVTDASGNPVSGATVIFTAPASGPSGTFQTGTAMAVAITDSNGLATAPTFTANSAVGGPYLVKATTADSTTPANFSLSNVSQVPSQVGFVQGPTTGVFNTALNPAVMAQLEDQFGNPVAIAGIPVSLTIGNNPGGATLSGGGPVLTDGNGVATFSNVKLSAGGVGYTLVASAGSLTQATSEAFNQASQLVFIQNPISAPANTVIAPPITVQAEDQFGNPVFGLFPVTMTIGTNPSGGTLSGTTTQTTDDLGQATFDDLQIDKEGTGYTLVASTGSLQVSSAAFNVTGAADAVAFVQQPSDAIINGTISPAVTVQVVDASGLPVGGTFNVTISIGNNPGGGTPSGTLTRTTDFTGLATFDDLSIDLPGAGYTLVATVSALPNPSVTSVPFNETAQLQFSTEPPNANLINTAISPPVVVQALDANGIPVSGISITLSIGANPGGSTLSGGGPVVTDSSGFATFSNLSLNNPGTGYTLVATAGVPGDSVTSEPFAEAGPATQVAFIQGPTSGTVDTVIAPPITVQVEDAFGNPVPGFFGISISLGTNPGGGVLLGTLGQTTDNFGFATFDDLFITAPGIGYTLVASSGTLTVATSTAFDQTTTQLSFVQQPSNGNSNTAISPSVQVEAVDEFGDPLSGVMITMTLGTNPGGGTLSGTLTQTTNAQGIATFSDLQIDQPGLGYTLVATSASPGSTSVTSAAFDQAGVATQLAFVQQPTSGDGGAVISPPVTVQVEDANGAPVSGLFSIVLTIGNNPGGGTLGGTTTQTTNAFGQATFDDLTISAVGTGYTLVATSGVLFSDTSEAFDQVGVPSELIFVQQPTSGVVGTALSPPVTVDVLDQFGNPLDGSFSVTVAIDNNPGGGDLGGTLTQTTNSSGQATFDDLTIDQPGTGYTLVASLSGVPSVTSAAFNQDTVASQLAFVQQPIIGTVGAVISPPVTVQVEDSFGNPKSGIFTVTIDIGANPGGGVLGGTLTRTTNSSGLATFSDLTISKPGTGYTLVASSGFLTGDESTAFDEVAPATHFQVTAPSQENASAPFLLTVTALDAFNNVVPTYTGTVHFTSSDAGAQLPGDYLFTTGPGGDNGVHSFAVTLSHGGAQTITATDTTSGTITGTATVTVVAPPVIPPVIPPGPPYLFITDKVGRRTRVRVFNVLTRSELFRFVPFPGFQGVLRLAQGDVNHDGILDVIVGMGPGGGRVRVINGRTHNVMAAFRPFPAKFRGGVIVDAADVNGDGFADVFVLTSMRHGVLRGRVFDGRGLARGQVILLETVVLRP